MYLGRVARLTAAGGEASGTEHPCAFCVKSTADLIVVDVKREWMRVGRWLDLSALSIRGKGAGPD